MVVKNANLGGADFATPSDRVKPTDLNDTFDAAAGFLTWCASNFNDLAQNLFNAAYLGFDARLSGAGVPLLDKVIYDVFTADTADATTGFFYNSTDDYYSTVPQIEGMTIFDDFPGSSLNATNWLGVTSGNGTQTVSGGLLRLGNASAGSSPGSSTVTSQNDMFTDIGTFGVVKLGTVTNSASNWTFKVQATDGPNTVDMFTGTPSNQEIYYEKVGNTLYYREGTSGAWSSQDISTWGTVKLKINLSSTGDGSTLEMTVQEVRGETLANAEIVSNYAPSESITELIPIINLPTSSDQTIAYLMSTDNSNFEIVTPKQVHRPANPGAYANLKVTVDYDDTQQIEDQETKLTEFATKYNML